MKHTAVAQRLLAALDGAHCIAQPTACDSSFALADAFAVGEVLRQARVARAGRALRRPRLPHRVSPVTLHRDGLPVESGHASSVLDGPLNALRRWVDAMSAQTPGWPIRAGDLVNTGTITDTWPLISGQRWHTTLSDPRLHGLRLATVG